MTSSTKISSEAFFLKKVFPVIWFGFLGLFLLVGILAREPHFALSPIFMMGFGFFFFKKLIWDLADEVLDCGDSLQFRKGSITQDVPLTEIMNISHQAFSSPTRVIVNLRNGGPLGETLAFSLPASLNVFSEPPIVRDLIKRVDEAKRR